VGVVDRLDRPLRDLRVSVTDRCNFRCRYCMPREVFGPDYTFRDRAELLTFEEITRIVASFARHGVRKVRLTGGEPLLRRDLAALIEMIQGVRGITDVALTTNGSLLASQAAGLKAAGLSRVTVSLDALDDPTFRHISDTPVPVARVLEGLAEARRVGLAPVKVNAVIRRGLNESAVDDLADFGREQGYTVRFIEYMDVGATNGWRLDDVVPAAEIIARIDARHPLEAVEPVHPAEVARRYRYRDGAGEVGVIASVSQPFCGSCVRARLSAVGELFTCLFASSGRDLRAVVRAGATDGDLDDVVAGIWRRRGDRYSEVRSSATADARHAEMSYLGG
jgi:GTP 3',8-cyclase